MILVFRVDSRLLGPLLISVCVDGWVLNVLSQKPKRRGRFSSPLSARQAGANLRPIPAIKLPPNIFKRCAKPLVQVEAYLNIH